MNETREELEAYIIERKEWIKDLETIGDKACCEFDLSMGYDANYYLNICPFPRSHIKWAERELAKMDKIPIQLCLFSS